MDQPKYILANVLHKMGEMGTFERMIYPDLQLFRYRLTVCGMDTMGVGLDMDEAKQEASGRMLNLLGRTGYPVPPPHGFDDGPDDSDVDADSILLAGFCIINNLDLNFALVDESDLDPQPNRYTVSVTVGGHGQRRASASTRKQAQEIASRAMVERLESVYGIFTLKSFLRLTKLNR